MKKRLRKKKHVGEFREYGFDVFYKFFRPLSKTEADAWWTRWVDFIESIGLLYGGGCAPDHYEGEISAMKGTATIDHRAAVVNWLLDQAEVVEWVVGELKDIWHA